MNKLAPYATSSIQALLPAPLPRLLRGQDWELDVWLTFEEAALGTTKHLHYRRPVPCTRCQRTGFEPGSQGQPCARCRGDKLEYRPTEVVAVFPVGLAEKERLRLKGYGAPGGDLFLVPHIWPHRYFQRKGFDVWLEVTVPVMQAILGTQTLVPSLYGPMKLGIPPGHPSGVPLKMPTLGIPNPRGGMGDQWVVPHVEIPTHLNRQQRALFAQLGVVLTTPSTPILKG